MEPQLEHDKNRIFIDRLNFEWDANIKIIQEKQKIKIFIFKGKPYDGSERLHVLRF